MNKSQIAKTEILLDLIDDVGKKDLAASFIYNEVGPYSEYLASVNRKLAACKKPSPLIKNSFFSRTRNILAKGHKTEQLLSDRIVAKKIKRIFRDLVGAYLFKSRISKRGFSKPLGYPGDYRVIEWVYDNKPISRGLGHCMDAYMLNDEYVRAVRDRKDTMKDALKRFLEKRSDTKELSILSLACGSSREIRELLKDDVTANGVTITLADQEGKALDYSRDKIKKLNISGGKIRTHYLKGDIISMISEKTDSPEGKVRSKKQDLVYSIGLVDYMPDSYFEKFINFYFSVLKNKGEFIFAHKNVIDHPSLASDWICDWNFIPRSKSRVLGIVKKALKGYRYGMKVKDIGSGCMYFVTLVKK